ncbi:MAG: TrkH family potassium uptake protein, partial [Oscillospiraceae bacterium]|nr:TrkH family potassium uptake protein [Oscillospiraceae bacterium]
SAFCNAGFDLMGKVSPGSSLISYGDNWYLNIVIMALIIIGGIGFFTWMDVVNNKHRLRRYKLQSKMVLVFSAVLIVAGTAVIFAVEYGGVAFEGKSFGDKLLLSLFQAVSPRTAGFATTDLTQLGISGKLVMTVLMAIGGSTGSTAGGIKTNTVMVLLFSIFAQYRKKKEVELFGRRIDGDVLRQACCVLMIFVTLAFICAVAIAAIEPLTLDAVLFEVVSALGTVGLSLGVTAQLSTVSQIIIILLMFIGRVGSITVLLMFTSGNLSEIQSKYPQEKIMVG